MKNKAFNSFKKRYFYIVFLVVLLLGAFLRFYHFSDWLHFELDQSRDAKVIDLAIKEGPGALPLLGPKAAGSFLRLGPVFYYFKYLSSLVFGNTPSGIATIIMIFGILAIPAFYILVRRYFNKWTSIGLLLLFSTSLFLVMYSRFSWNPNPLPLFTILAIYSLLRAVDREEKNKGKWLLAAAFFISVATQLHFLAYVSFPVITAAFLIIKRPKIKWAYWTGAIGIILLMNFPVILNEIKTGGDNFKEFKEVVSGKTEGKSEKSLLAKIVKNYSENSVGHFLILSSQNSELPRVLRNPNLNILCDQGCKKELPYGIVAAILFSSGLLLMLKNLVFEKDLRKKDFIVLISLWFIAVFGLFTPLAFDISPRFWLLVSALPFIFLGFTLDFIGKIFPQRIAVAVALIVILGFSASSLYRTYLRFTELKNAPYKTVKVSADRILKERQRVTMEQQYMITNYIESFYQKNKYPVYLNSSSFYRRSLLFDLSQRDIPESDFRDAVNGHTVYRNGNYFLVYPTDSNLEGHLEDYSISYDYVNKKQFGTLMVIQLAPKPEAINAEEEIFEDSGGSKSAAGVPKRYTWQEIFDSTGSEDEEEE
ncbi:MAG: glycosyltransferase family 39 protein [Parcubacteria group bacterium]|jgi:hypothetical protein